MKYSQRLALHFAAALLLGVTVACVPARTRVRPADSAPARRGVDATSDVRGPSGAEGHGSAPSDRRDSSSDGSGNGATGSPLPDSDYLRRRSLMVPVDGVSPSQVRNDFSAPRGSRRHNALDIMAPRGTPVVSADDGRVLSMRRNTAGGLIIYVVDTDERLIYYYAHLDGYRSGLREGDRVRKGEVLGYVGTTGNAPDDAPHLHFQVMRYDDPRRYWEGTPLNPHGYFAEEGRKRDE